LISKNAHLGNRNHKFSAAAAILGLLLDDLIGEIPGEQQDVFGLVVQQSFRRDHWYMGAGRIQSLFQRAAVNDVREQVGADFQETEQCIPFGRRAVAGDTLPPPRQLG